MAELIFIGTVLSLLTLIVALVVQLVRRRPFRRTVVATGVLLAGYAIVWLLYDSNLCQKEVPFGTDICFDDWCATVTRVDRGREIQQQFATISGDSTWLVVHVKISNHARGLAQKPSEPRVLITNPEGNRWTFSPAGQQLLEKNGGKLPALDSRLELAQSLETEIVFAAPADAKGLEVLIEEGPPLINLLIFPQDERVFVVGE